MNLNIILYLILIIAPVLGLTTTVWLVLETRKIPPQSEEEGSDN